MFKNRQDAGQQLAEVLSEYKSSADAVVLALPRGGVVTGYEIAKVLKLPLDIVVPRKIGAPGNPEFAIGAITETGEAIFNEEVLQDFKIEQSYLDQMIEVEQAEAKRRLATYRGDKPARNLKDKTVILVDDGIATGMTMKAAIKTIKAEKASKIVVAVPVAPSDTIKEIREIVDDVIVLKTPRFFGAIGAFYETFDQTEDEEVVKIMEEFK